MPKELGVMTGLDPEFLRRYQGAQAELATKGIQLYTTSPLSGVRTVEQQAGLRARKGVKAAKPSATAPHVSGRALDLGASGKGITGIQDPAVKETLYKWGLHDPLTNTKLAEPWHWESKQTDNTNSTDALANEITADYEL